MAGAQTPVALGEVRRKSNPNSGLFGPISGFQAPKIRRRAETQTQDWRANPGITL